MDTFRRLFLAALCAGLASGIFITVVHHIGTTQLILAAEVYERAGDAPAVTYGADGAQAPAADAAGADAGHAHAAGDWAPADGLERSLYTALADALTGIGFSLVLVAAYRFRGARMDWRNGLFWGLSGFLSFVAAPGLGLPPELPGTAAAALADRQAWWFLTVALTGAGLALIFLGRRPVLAALGLALIVAPQAYGAPQPAMHDMSAPAELAHRFVVAATVTGLLFWAVLGALTGFFYGRFVGDADA